MKSFAYPAGIIAVLLCSMSPPRAGAEPATRPATRPTEAGQFMRFVEDGKGGGKLQTAIITYKNAAGVTLHLVAAVHVGDKAYYEGLNKTFESYDALLYELIMQKGARPPAPGQKSHSALSAFQRFLKDVLSLDFQLDDIDYTRPNFIHADLDVDTFEAMQNERGESLFGIMLQSMLRELERQAAGKGSAAKFDMLDLLIALRAPDRPRQFKLLLGRQFDDVEEQMSGLDGPNGSVLVTERNKKCVATLKQAIADGHVNIGIFYGAAHMHDLSQRVEALGFHKTGVQWRTSWDMSSENK